MSASVVCTHEKLLKQGKCETGGENRPGEAGSFGSPPGPSCHWSRMEGLKDREPRGSVLCLLRRNPAGRCPGLCLCGTDRRSELLGVAQTLAAPGCLSADDSEAWPLPPAVSRNPGVFLSLTRSLASHHTKAIC